jgi:integrase
MPRPNSGPKLKSNKRRGGFYYIHWTERGRSCQQSTRTRNRKEAEVELAKFLMRRQQHDGPRDPSEVLIMDALENYSRKFEPGSSSGERAAYAIQALASFWGHMTAADVSEHLCKEYQLHRGVKVGTIRRELGVLRAALNGEHPKRMTRMVEIKLPPKPDGKDRWLTRSEVGALLRAARSEPKARLHLPLFIIVALRTGARKGAVLDLRFTQVNLETKRINFNPPERQQTDKKRPIIPIPKRLVWFLRKARERSGELGYVINRNGKPLADISTAFNTACRKAKLNDVTPHTLRHTAGTWMAQAGVPLWQIAGYLGHSVQRTTELYAHHSPDYLQDAADAMNGKPKS